MATYRDTYKYHFKLGNKIVHTGITNDIDRREAEHKREHGQGKGHIKQIGLRTTLDAAPLNGNRNRRNKASLCEKDRC